MTQENTVSAFSPESVPVLSQYFHSYRSGQSLNMSTSALLQSASIPLPVIIKDLTDDEATVIMVDSNIQREELLISEKAFAYKMKYEALKRQGKRSDLTSCQVGKKLAAEEVSQNTGDSSRQILRYIHLTELVAELLELADEKKLPFNTAVELSYLRTEEQQILFQYMSNHNMVPSMKQAKELKQISKERMLTYSEIDQICMNEST